ncbi:MAG: 4-oxalocrotonate tautomerase family protein [Candidatus Velthaea sp.]
MITVQIACATPSSELSRSVADAISDLTASILGKDPKVTSVAVQFVDPQHWYIGGERLARLGQAAFFLETRISDGTNTKAEKAEYVARAFAAMRRILGGTHEESYVHVHDARADPYGYGGVTQERRFIVSTAVAAHTRIPA